MSYSFRKFRPDTDVLKPFDCGIADLNGFLLETSGEIPNAMRLPTANNYWQLLML